MTKSRILTAESVTEGHPDKLCDYIADCILDACLEKDKNVRVACEVMATAGKIIAAGEITTKILPDIPHIICQAVKQTGYVGLDYEVEIILHAQSPDIVQAINGVGAGDQGIAYGYATDETAEMLPLPVVLAHKMTKLLSYVRKSGKIKRLLPDGKAQVSIEYSSYDIPKRAVAVVLSAQHEANKDIRILRNELMEHVIRPVLGKIPYKENDIHINPSGRFVLGGFEADTGLTGRKLMVDSYGGLAPHGGGAFSGKDATKVDRSGAYMARYIAKNIIAAGLAEECTVSLAYAIGKAEPVAVSVDTYGSSKLYDDGVIAEAVRAVFDLTPQGIIRELRLQTPFFSKTTNYGHFTDPCFPWEQMNRTDELRIICQVIDGQKTLKK